MSTQPVRFAPSVETIADDEAETLASLKDSFREILETTSQDYAHAVRAVHAKAHGIARGTLTIADGLPETLAQGIFAQPGRHEAVLRISTTAGDILDDSVSLSLRHPIPRPFRRTSSCSPRRPTGSTV
jgi:hypothetical protein